MEQNLGPHMEQKWAVLAGSWGSVASWNNLAVTGSSDRLNWSYLQWRHFSGQLIAEIMQLVPCNHEYGCTVEASTSTERGV